jgi:hypothetical protein
MNAVPRFILDDERRIIDILNPRRRKGYCPEGDSESQINLRDGILRVRLSDLVEDLFVIGPIRGVFHAGGDSLWRALYYAIRATRLYALDPEVALQRRFDGKLKREKKGLKEETTLQLFTDDVEHVLRDLFGDLDPEALDAIVTAVFIIVREFCQYAYPDLWQECSDAEDWDRSRGIGVPPECEISYCERESGECGFQNLVSRARKVFKSPQSYSRYTVAFITKNFQDLPKEKKLTESQADADEATSAQ